MDYKIKKKSKIEIQQNDELIFKKKHKKKNKCLLANDNSKLYLEERDLQINASEIQINSNELSKRKNELLDHTRKSDEQEVTNKLALPKQNHKKKMANLLDNIESNEIEIKEHENNNQFRKNYKKGEIGKNKVLEQYDFTVKTSKKKHKKKIENLPNNLKADNIEIKEYEDNNQYKKKHKHRNIEENKSLQEYDTTIEITSSKQKYKKKLGNFLDNLEANKLEINEHENELREEKRNKRKIQKHKGLKEYDSIIETTSSKKKHKKQLEDLLDNIEFNKTEENKTSHLKKKHENRKIEENDKLEEYGFTDETSSKQKHKKKLDNIQDNLGTNITQINEHENNNWFKKKHKKTKAERNKNLEEYDFPIETISSNKKHKKQFKDLPCNMETNKIEENNNNQLRKKHKNRKFEENEKLEEYDSTIEMSEQKHKRKLKKLQDNVETNISEKEHENNNQFRKTHKKKKIEKNKMLEEKDSKIETSYQKPKEKKNKFDMDNYFNFKRNSPNQLTETDPKEQPNIDITQKKTKNNSNLNTNLAINLNNLISNYVESTAKKSLNDNKETELEGPELEESTLPNFDEPKGHSTPVLNDTQIEPQINCEIDKTMDIDFLNDHLDLSLQNLELSGEEKDTLRELHVIIPWEVPPSHTIETRMAYPTGAQRKVFKELDINLKLGPFTKAEDEIIKTNWLDFCKMHNLPDNPLPFLALRGAYKKNILRRHERLKFVRFLGRNLENRMLYSIYLRFHKLFKTYNKGKFTVEEDNIILTYMKHSNSKQNIFELATLLNRTKDSVQKRRDILKSENREHFKPDLETKKNIIEYLMEVTGKNVIEDLRSFVIERSHWKKVEEKMNIPAIKLRRHWLLCLYPQLFIRNYNTVEEIYVKLINLLYDNYSDDRKEIIWNEIALDVEGATAAYLRDLFHNLIWSHVPPIIRYQFNESLNYLKNTYLLSIANKTPITKLEYCKGELKKIK